MVPLLVKFSSSKHMYFSSLFMFKEKKIFFYFILKNNYILGGFWNCFLLHSVFELPFQRFIFSVLLICYTLMLSIYGVSILFPIPHLDERLCIQWQFHI